MKCLTSVSNIDGSTTTLAYSATTNLLTAIYEPSGTVFVNHSDGINLTSLTAEDGTPRVFGYDANSDLTSDVWGPYQTTISGDAHVSQIDLGNVESYAILPAAFAIAANSSIPASGSGVALVTDGNNDTTAYTCDNEDRETGDTEPTGLTESWSYGSLGLVTLYVDARGEATGYQYDSVGGLKLMSNPDGSTESYQYDPTFHQLIQSVDEDGNTTSYILNQYGDQVQMTLTSVNSPLPDITTYSWSNGLMQTMTDPDGNTTYYFYDGDRRETEEEVKDSNGIVKEETTYSYDNAGNPLVTTVGAGGSASRADDDGLQRSRRVALHDKPRWRHDVQPVRRGRRRYQQHGRQGDRHGL